MGARACRACVVVLGAGEDVLRGQGLGGGWCHVAMAGSEAGFSSRALVSLLLHKAGWLPTSVSPEKISFDRLQGVL